MRLQSDDEDTTQSYTKNHRNVVNLLYPQVLHPVDSTNCAWNILRKKKTSESSKNQNLFNLQLQATIYIVFTTTYIVLGILSNLEVI